MSVKSSLGTLLSKWPHRFAYCVQVVWNPEGSTDLIAYTLGVQRTLPLWLPGQRALLLRWVQEHVGQPQALIVSITYLGVLPVAPEVQFKNHFPGPQATIANVLPEKRVRYTEHKIIVPLTPSEASDPEAVPGMQYKWTVPGDAVTMLVVPGYLKDRVDLKRWPDGSMWVPRQFVLITDNGDRVDLNADDVVRTTRVSGWALDMSRSTKACSRPATSTAEGVMADIKEQNAYSPDPLTELPAAPRSSMFAITAPAPRCGVWEGDGAPPTSRTWVVAPEYRAQAVPVWLRGRILRPCDAKAACTLVCDNGELMGLYAGDRVELKYINTLPPARYCAGDTVMLNTAPDRTYGASRARISVGTPYKVIAGPYGYNEHNVHQYTLQHEMGGVCYDGIRESSLYFFRREEAE